MKWKGVRRQQVRTSGGDQSGAKGTTGCGTGEKGGDIKSEGIEASGT